MKVKQSITQKHLSRILLFIIICLSLATGYYQVALELEIKEHKKVEDQYVRVRSILGREKTQELIDLSHELEELETELKN
ncbi:MAG: hypothetical protein PVJ09_04725 [Candidatus Woesebacteria bacterium]|jgi:hypothetical protein